MQLWFYSASHASSSIEVYTVYKLGTWNQTITKHGVEKKNIGRLQSSSTLTSRFFHFYLLKFIVIE